MAGRTFADIADLLSMARGKVTDVYNWVRRTHYLTISLLDCLRQSFLWGDEDYYTAERLGLPLEIVKREYARLHQRA